MTTHHFQPTHYFITMGSHAPVLRIAPGDTVVTTTIDARGFDARREQVGANGNPMTGPFYVEGAEPGDTLVVHLERLTPNRAYGWSASVLSANVVEPEHVRELPPRITADWRIDGEMGTATLEAPKTALPNLTLPLAPMIGCFGVAPYDGQAISCATSGEHGGNMDYNGFREGVTAYFPVFAEGALFHIGDGHARQGDGEISGTGIEVSMDVQFRVDLIKGKRIGFPRGENDTHIFTAGNARPLDQALQHATSEMLRWLMADYGLDAQAASIVLGQCVEFDVGNVYDPAYTMICKLSKSRLNELLAQAGLSQSA